MTVTMDRPVLSSERETSQQQNCNCLWQKLKFGFEHQSRDFYSDPYTSTLIYGDSAFLRNVRIILQNYMTSHPGKTILIIIIAVLTAVAEMANTPLTKTLGKLHPYPIHNSYFRNIQTRVDRPSPSRSLIRLCLPPTLSLFEYAFRCVPNPNYMSSQ
jgi:hypothetical protein